MNLRTPVTELYKLKQKHVYHQQIYSLVKCNDLKIRELKAVEIFYKELNKIIHLFVLNDIFFFPILQFTIINLLLEANARIKKDVHVSKEPDKGTNIFENFEFNWSSLLSVKENT